MSQPTAMADALGIVEGFRVRVVGDSVEETALLDPLPEGVETFDHHVHELDACLILTDHETALVDHLDEVLPHLGSVGLVWVIFPPSELDPEDVARVVSEYGWDVSHPVPLDETWSAARLALT